MQEEFTAVKPEFPSFVGPVPEAEIYEHRFSSEETQKYVPQQPSQSIQLHLLLTMQVFEGSTHTEAESKSSRKNQRL